MLVGQVMILSWIGKTFRFACEQSFIWGKSDMDLSNSASNEKQS